MKPITEFRTTVDLLLPPNPSPVRRAVNRYFTGRDTIPPDEEVPPELRKAHERMNMTHRISVVVEVMENGGLRLKPITEFQTTVASQPPTAEELAGEILKRCYEHFTLNRSDPRDAELFKWLVKKIQEVSSGEG